MAWASVAIDRARHRLCRHEIVSRCGLKNDRFKGDSKLADKCHTVTFSDPDKRPPELRDSSRSVRRLSLPGIVIILAWN